MKQRLQKLLSEAGLCSRRQAELWIESGRVTVNGRIAAVGEKADPDVDHIAVDDKPLSRPGNHTYIMLHKPRGYVTTLSDEKGRKTIVDLVKNCPARVWPVGRLDMDSEGLLLLTDDGEFTQRLTHPSHRVEKEYVVHVTGNVANALPILANPMVVDGEDMMADRVGQTGKGTLSIVIHQGKNRQVRRMCAAAGLKVIRLIRVREGRLLLGDLPKGQWRYLTPKELLQMREG